MESDYKTLPLLDRLLARWGGAYILRMQSITQLISFLAAVIGILYILLAANLNEIQTVQLLVSVLILVIMANLLIPIYTALATTTARAQLDTIFKGKPTPKNKTQEELDASAWREVNILPWRYAIVEALTAYLLVVLPVILFMRWIGGVELVQAVHIAIGGFLSATAVVVQNVLFLERVLGPVRRSLLPKDIEQQKFTIGLRLETRFQVIIVVLIITAIMMIGLIGYQKLLNASLPGADISSEILQFQGQVIALGLMILLLGLFLGRMMIRSVSLPVQEIVKTLERAQKGDLSARATILASDETSQLTLHLNRLLDQLKAAQANLEKEVDERTADLNRKTAHLQAAARVSRDASAARDVSTLLTRTVDLVAEYFSYYHIGIYLLDSAGEYAILQAASSEGGKKMIARGHRVEAGQRGIVGVAAHENRPRVVSDTSQDAVFMENPDLPLTRSEAAIPLAARGKVIGVLDIQSIKQSAFSPDEIDLLQTLADQLALAIQNTMLIEESRSALTQLETALSENVRRAWSERGGQKRAYHYTPTGLAVSPVDGGKPPAEAEGVTQINIPITLRGQLLGTIALHRKGENTWSDADRLLATEVANQIGLALENSRLLQDAQHRAVHEQMLSNLTARLGQSVDADTLLQTTVRELRQLPDVTEVSVFLAPPESAGSGEES